MITCRRTKNLRMLCTTDVFWELQMHVGELTIASPSIWDFDWDLDDHCVRNRTLQLIV